MKTVWRMLIHILPALVLTWFSFGIPAAVLAAPQLESRGQDATNSAQLDTADQLLDGGWATQIAAGHVHTCALTVDSGVKCWGFNTAGQLGDATTRPRAAAADVLGLGEGVVLINAGSSHTCALTPASGVKCWGENADGQLGDGTTVDRLTPVAVVGLSSGVRGVSAGKRHTCAFLNSGAIKCWGNNAYGQLGDGTATSHLTPVDVVGLTSGVQALDAGDDHTCAIDGEGGVKCWGDNRAGELGDGTQLSRLSPIDVVGLDGGTRAVSAGGSFTCALNVNGGVKCWGGNSVGQLGDGTTTLRLTPVDVMSLSAGASAVSAGGAHACALTAGGGVKCWGFNNYGQLGDGTITWRLTPVAVTGLSAGATAVSAGDLHTCAVLAGGAAQCWGWNEYAQLGDGTTVWRRTPVDVWNLVYDCATVTEIPAPECSALVTLFNATNGSLWQDHTNWLRTTMPCSWHGVTCEAGHVSQLNLPANNLVDALPAALSDLAGLQRLDLRGNNLTGALPVALGNLTALQHLDLSTNQFTGALPLTLGNLAALQTLDLHNNTLTGALPGELGSLTALQYLDLSHNYMSGELPKTLRQLTHLQHFDLSHNLFEGTLLWNYWRFADFPALTYLDFSYNRLTSLLPEGLDSLTVLTYLDLSHNRFAWELPWELGDLPHLTYLNLADNQLTGSVPPPFGNLAAVQRLDLSANYLRGPLPPELGQLRALTHLDLHSNLLSGAIPPELGTLGAAVAITPTGATPPPGVYIDLSSNHLIGAIPAELGQNAAIMGLQLSGNQLNGLVPATLTDRQYYALDLNYNQLADADPRWRETQTVPPTAVQAVTTTTGVTLTWPLIPYKNDGGFYEISYATTPQGPFTVHGHTFNKWYDSYTVSGLPPDSGYYFRVRTFTPAHDYRASSDVFDHIYIQPNNLWSDYTPLVSVGVTGTATPTPTATPSATATPTPTATPTHTAGRVWLPLVRR